MEDGDYGAISRDLPILITTSPCIPAPHYHFPSWDSLFPRPQVSLQDNDHSSTPQAYYLLLYLSHDT